MGTIRVCDVCGGDLHIENQHAEFKIPKAFWLQPAYDGFTAYTDKRRLEICFNCWHKFRDWIKENGNTSKNTD